MESPVTTQHGLYWMDEGVWQAGIDILSSQGALKSPLKAADVMALDVLQQAHIV